MALPTGQISMGQVNTELGLSSTAQISFNDSAVRSLAGVSSGQIGMSNLQGKSNSWSGTISTNQAALNLRTWALANGWNGTVAAVITINSGVTIQQTTQGTSASTAPAPSLVIDGSWPGGVTLINNGRILGRGGFGGGNPAAIAAGSTYLGQTGGNAISLGVSCTITNNGIIAGGGGGGGFAAGGVNACCSGGGGNSGGGGGAGNGAAGAYGTGTLSFAAGNSTTSQNASYGVGGTAGGSGYDTCCYYGWSWFANGGSGGIWGSNGVAGNGNQYSAPAGAGGFAVRLNGYTVTWNATGTRWGSVG